MKPIYAYRLVTCTIQANTAAAEVNFQDVPELHGKRIVAIEAFDESQITYTPDGLPVITAANALFITLTLKDPTSLERLKDVPLWTLNPVYMAGIYKQFEPFEVNWQSSFSKLNSSAFGATTRNVVLGIAYEL